MSSIKRQKPITTAEARNETQSAQHYAKGIDIGQQNQASIMDTYFSTLLGGNRFVLDEDRFDQQFLTHSIFEEMLSRVYKRYAETEAHNISQANKAAHKDLLEIAQA